MEQAHGNLPAISKSELRQLLERRNSPGAAHLSAHVALIGLTSLSIAMASGSIWTWPAMLVQGILLVSLFAPLHESIHRTAFRSRGFNDAIGFVVGLILMLPREYFRAFHFAHHRFTQDPAKDPELAVPKPKNIASWLWIVSGMPYWIGQVATLFRHAAGQAHEHFLAHESMRRRIVREARMVLSIYAVLLGLSFVFQSSALIWYWLLPVFLGQPFLRLYLLAEHTGCPLVEDMLVNSRTTHTNGLVRFLAWNMPYHAEHHLYPSVPFHALPVLSRKLPTEPRVMANGYFAVHRELLKSLAT